MNINMIVQKTTDYAKFRTLKGNRDVSHDRVAKIIKSIKNVGYIINPIIVNEKMQVIDGQGRLQALTELKMPVYYLVVPHTGIKECISMNIYQEKWSTIDYVKSYAKRGSSDYQTLLKAIIEFYPNIPIGIIVTACSGSMNNVSTEKVFKGDFQMGRDNWKDALNYLNKYTPYKNQISGSWANLTKVLLFAYDAPEIDENIMYKQFVKNATKLPGIGSIIDALNALEVAYNTRRREKVYFRPLYDKRAEERGHGAGIATRKKNL